MSINCKVIERTEKEYLEELYGEYKTKIKPLLDEGKSLCYATKVHKLRSPSKYYQMREFALADGYKLRSNL